VTAREEILGRVRAAIGDDRPVVPPGLERLYNAHSSDGVETFIERVHDYGARTWSLREGDLAVGVRQALADLGLRRLIAPDGLPADWLEGSTVVRDSPPLEPWELEAADGVLTTCAVAIAQTGTIVLDGSAGMGRRILSLVPDRLLCVVRANQLVGSLPDALARLDPLRPLTFISGPSATVDIEMVRVAGVHGPRQLGVVIVR
jgi:L-lactate dehydrogenase complex protein LldG